ncbi:MAG: hypothetical protein F6K19_32130 [Cyanothece sp. SIO1E1]|nr:hypothetical protein [Cyanothece sp. SIO1E1]
MQASDFFKYPKATTHKHYEALRAFLQDGRPAAQVAQRFSYTLSSFYSLNRDFKQQLQQSEPSQGFFVTVPQGRRLKDETGLFAGLNVLPKTAWFSSYSHRVSRDMNRDFLKALHACWQEHALLSDCAHLDFTTIPD